MKVALVHDFLKEYGGAERVLEALHEIFPHAPVYTSFLDLKGLGPHAKEFKKWDVHTSWLQKIPGVRLFYSPLRIFAPLMFESFDLSKYDLVISSSAAYFAKAAITQPGTLHIAYIHTPPRYLYGYATAFNYKKNPLVRFFGEVTSHFLRLWDSEISRRPDVLVANSQNIAGRIKKFYRRESAVIYPPVDLDQFKGVKKEEWKYFLSLNRLVRGKGTEIVVEACSRLDLPLKVAGSGPELQRLQNIAGKSVEFLGHVSDEERVKLFAGAKATIVASEDEDFGIVPVESMAAGTPVIAIATGGFLETVVKGETGEFFWEDKKEDQVESLTKVLKKFDPKKYKTEDCKKQAEKFSKERFKKEILDLVEKNFPR